MPKTEKVQYMEDPDFKKKVEKIAMKVGMTPSDFYRRASRIYLVSEEFRIMRKKSAELEDL